MRKHFVPLVLSLLLFACDKQMPEEIVRQDIIVPTGSVFDTGISFDAGQGQTRAIRFTATDNWKANVTDTKASTWLSVEPSAGDAGEVQMSVSAQPNTTEASREAKVTITCGKTSKNFTVSQAGTQPVVVGVTEVKLNKTYLELEKGASETLVATVLPENATDKTVNWSSSNEEKAVVSSSGKVVALQGGEAVITAKAGSKEAKCTVTITVPVESITLDQTSISLEENQSTLLTATVKPDDATDKTVTWSSSNEKVATVAEGRVTTLKEGTATITASCGGKSATCAVTVKKKVVPVESISLNKSELPLVKGASETLIANVTPDNATDKTVTWSSSNANIASVDQTGKVTAMAGGEAVITAKAGSKEAKCTVTITVPVESITLDQTSISLEENQSTLLTATVKPDDATDKTVTWSSSNEKVATVAKGRVTSLKEGTAIITASCGGKTAICNVTVKKHVVPVESVSLDHSSITINKYDSWTLSATVSPKNATEKTVAWSSSNTAVARVDQSGTVTGAGSGTATITASCGGKSATCEVTVVVPVVAVSLNYSSISLEEGQSRQLTASITPFDATDQKVTWSSSNTSIATVTDGLVKAISEGTASITASCGGKSASCAVTVTKSIVPVTGISMAQSNAAQVKVGESTVWAVIITPNNATNKSVTWSVVMNPDVASVDQNGRITGLSAGEATIRATASNGMYVANTIVVLPNGIPVESIEFPDTNPYSVQVGKSVVWKVIVKPDDATDKTITWSIYKNPEFASVDQNGRITGLAEGQSTVKATASNGRWIARTITVTTATVPVESVSLDHSSITINKYDSWTLSATVSPKNATEKTVAWSSSNTAVARVDQSGTVTGAGSGTATITASCGGKSATCEVTVVVPVVAVSLNYSSISLEEGQNRQLTASITPFDATDQIVTWSSSNTSIATVTDGLVTARSEGTATITASCGGKSATCAVTVTKKVIPVETIFMDENNPSSVYVGSSIVWKAVISPENATDKTIIWSIEDNPGSASVDQFGRITGLAAGSAIVRATATNGQWVQSTIRVLSTTVPVERVSLNYSSVTLEESETRTLTASVYPENATDKTVTWASSNTSVATVTDGLVIAVSEGTATITASCGGKSATCAVTVTKKVIPVEAIFMDNSNPSSVYVGSSVVWKAIIAPENATDKTIIWSITENPGNASVDQFGRITGLAAGSAIVRATTTNGQWVQSTIQVLSTTVPVERVSLNFSSITLQESETRTLTASVYPENATDKTVTWASSNTSVATVVDGLVTAVREGTATITASCGGKSATCAVTVTKKVIPVEAIFMDNSNPSSVYVGSSVVWKAIIAPENATDKTIIWSITENPGNASVDQFGTITGLAEGNAIVRATTANGQWAQGSIRVLSTTVPVERVSLNYSSITLNKSETRALTATVYPENATNKMVTWASSNTSVASVTNDGLITAHNKGTATITAFCEGKYATCEVTVVVPVTAVFLNYSDVVLEEGQNIQLIAEVQPNDASDQTVTWTSSNTSVVTVANGLVTAISEGFTTVTASCGEQFAICYVTVTGKRIPVERISLDYSSVAIGKSETRHLIVTIYPYNATDRNVSWSSSNNAVASVDQQGNVTGVNTGSATITAKVGELKAECIVTVVNYPASDDPESFENEEEDW